MVHLRLISLKEESFQKNKLARAALQSPGSQYVCPCEIDLDWSHNSSLQDTGRHKLFSSYPPSLALFTPSPTRLLDPTPPTPPPASSSLMMCFHLFRKLFGKTISLNLERRQDQMPEQDYLDRNTLPVFFIPRNSNKKILNQWIGYEPHRQIHGPFKLLLRLTDQTSGAWCGAWCAVRDLPCQ